MLETVSSDQAKCTHITNSFVAQARLCVLTYRIALRCQIEWLGFLRHRSHVFDSCLDDLIESMELNDAFDVLADYAQNMAAEYPQELAKIATVASTVELKGARLAQKLADDAVGDMGVKTIS